MWNSVVSAAETGGVVAKSVVIARSGTRRGKFLMSIALVMRLSHFCLGRPSSSATHRSRTGSFRHAARFHPPYSKLTALRLPCNRRRRPWRQRFRIDLDDAATDAHAVGGELFGEGR